MGKHTPPWRAAPVAAETVIRNTLTTPFKTPIGNILICNSCIQTMLNAYERARDEGCREFREGLGAIVAWSLQ
jgi:hypothetical protein